jgi:hypothetical protein
VFFRYALDLRIFIFTQGFKWRFKSNFFFENMVSRTPLAFYAVDDSTFEKISIGVL